MLPMGVSQVYIEPVWRDWDFGLPCKSDYGQLLQRSKWFVVCKIAFTDSTTKESIAKHPNLK